MSNLYVDLIDSIDAGKQGKNQGLPTGYNRLDSYICGIQKGRYDVVFGREGTGKSAFTDCSYVLNPYDFLKKENRLDKLEILYYSLEMSRQSKIAKWCCWKIYKDTNHKLLVDTNYILSKGKNRISNDIYQKVVETANYFEEMSDMVHIYDDPLNPTGIWKQVNEYALRNGTITTEESGRKVYKANNPEKYVIIIVDTAGNLTLEKVADNYNVKSTIDKCSEYLRIFRNKFNYSPVLVSHANRSIDDINKVKYGEIFHTLSDIKDSNQPGQDANTVMCIFNPLSYMNPNNDMNKFMGYDIDKLRDRFRCVGVLKNREGEDNVRVGMGFIGEIGSYFELPKSKDMEAKHYKYIESISKITE
jgi:replicative DNA helicase